jgi:hypothetical protein
MMSDADMFRWAKTQMDWERAVAKERGTELPRIRGIRRLRARTHTILTNRTMAPQVRGKVAATRIEQAVRRAYGLGIE